MLGGSCNYPVDGRQISSEILYIVSARVALKNAGYDVLAGGDFERRAMATARYDSSGILVSKSLVWPCTAMCGRTNEVITVP